MQPKKSFAQTFLLYAAILAGMVLAFVYYKGLTTDVQTVAPYVVQLGALFQGRNPYSGGFSGYVQ